MLMYRQKLGQSKGTSALLKSVSHTCLILYSHVTAFLQPTLHVACLCAMHSQRQQQGPRPLTSAGCTFAACLNKSTSGAGAGEIQVSRGTDAAESPLAGPWYAQQVRQPISSKCCASCSSPGARCTPPFQHAHC